MVVNGGPVEEAANFASTGEAITSARVVDATGDLSAEVTAGGADSVVVVDGSAGGVSDGDTSTLGDGQVVMGGGSTLNVVGRDSGAAAVFTGPGTRPTVDGTNASNHVFQIANE